MRKSTDVNSHDLSQLKDCKSLATNLHSKLLDKHIICLNGPMGVGKTQLIQYILDCEGFKQVSSPTFSLQNIYELKKRKVYHFDFHRLESEFEIETVGLWEAFDKPAWVFIEWSDKIPMEDLPIHWPLLHLVYDKNRRVSVTSYAAALAE